MPSTPTGLTVDVKVPQQGLLGTWRSRASGRTRLDRDAAGGRRAQPLGGERPAACSEEQVGFRASTHRRRPHDSRTVKPSCPDASKLGIVHIKTPLLTHELEGSVYLATPAPNGEAGKNPFNSLVALYLVAEDPVSGVLVKLAGEGHSTKHSCRSSTTFQNTPQVPFEELNLELFGGDARRSRPQRLRNLSAREASFTPWSGTGRSMRYPRRKNSKSRPAPGGGGCPAARWRSRRRSARRARTRRLARSRTSI